MILVNFAVKLKNFEKATKTLEIGILKIILDYYSD